MREIWNNRNLLMEQGTTNYLEVLTARQTLLSAQLNQTANRFTEIQSLISLYPNRAAPTVKLGRLAFLS